MNTTRLFRPFFIISISLLCCSMLTAQVKIKERVEIKSATISYEQLSKDAGQTVSYPFFSEAYFNGMQCVKANFPIEGYKAKINWSVNIDDFRPENGVSVNYGLAQFPYGPVIDVIALYPGQSGAINGSTVIDKDYYAWGNQYIEFIAFNGSSSIGSDPSSVTVNATGDTALYNFSSNGTYSA